MASCTWRRKEICTLLKMRPNPLEPLTKGNPPGAWETSERTAFFLQRTSEDLETAECWSVMMITLPNGPGYCALTDRSRSTIISSWAETFALIRFRQRFFA